MEVRFFLLFQKQTFKQAPVHRAGLFLFCELKTPHHDFRGKHLTQPLLKLGGLSRVTGVPCATLLRWWDRNTIESCRFDVTTSGSGEYRQFSRVTVNKIAIAKKLIGLGIGAGPAITAAAQFTDFGDENRVANELFEFGLSVLVHAEGGTLIRNLDPESSLADVFGRNFDSCITVNIGPIIKTLDTLISNTKKDSK